MVKMRKIIGYTLGLLCLLALPECTMGGPARIAFNKSELAFGVVNETQEVVEFTFDFTNEGGEALTLQKVESSCGCLVATFNNEPVPAGGAGQIKVRFNPEGYPGAFYKTLTVHSNAANGPQVLGLKGIIKPKNLPIQQWLPMQIGALRLRNKVLNLGNFNSSQPYTQTFELHNQGTNSLKVDSIWSSPDVQVQVQPASIAPQTGALLQVTIQPNPERPLGFFSQALVLYTNDAATPVKTLTLQGAGQRPLPNKETLDPNEVPAIVLSETLFEEVEEVTQGDTLATSFVIQNQGGGTLLIDRIVANCACTKVQADTYALKPGRSTRVKVTFFTAGRIGRQHKIVDIFTNDPVTPVSRFILRTIVLEKDELSNKD